MDAEKVKNEKALPPPHLCLSRFSDLTASLERVLADLAWSRPPVRNLVKCKVGSLHSVVTIKHTFADFVRKRGDRANFNLVKFA